ncbi:MAG: dCMP deaminase family protein [bacterium]|nr:dCMP deaminase family protein [bacterium]
MENKGRISWDDFFMSVAQLYAERSACKHFKVGVVFAKDKRILSGGYNGPPSGEPHCTEVGCAKEDKNGKRLPAGSGLCRGAHAETNAIANASSEGINLRGSTVYCIYSPCYDCAKVLVNLGIKEFVYLKEYGDEDKSLAKELFSRHKILVRKKKI